MSRLPAIAGDNSTWGTVLNDYLTVSHGADGTDKNCPARLAGSTAKAAKTPFYNVKDYGATGDNVTDDTAAIQAAVNAVVATGGTLYFPSGSYLWTAPVTPNATTNGIVVLGAGNGVGNNTGTQLRTTMTNNFMFANVGNEIGWTWAHLSFVGPSAASSAGAAIDGSQVLSFGSGFSTAFNGFFWNDLTVISCSFSGFSVGSWMRNCHETLWLNCHWLSNRNVGLALAGGITHTIVGGMAQVQNASGGAATTEVVANILLCNDIGGGAANGPTGAHIDMPVIDELGLNAQGGGASLWVAAGTDIEITTKQIYAAGKKQPGKNPYYGIRLGPKSVRTRINGTRVMPFAVDATRVPDNTILIESGATDTVLVDVSTDPNLANGGGDISDAGTRTVYRNIRLNNGPPITAIATKAGVPVDGDYNVAPPVGTQVLDTTDGKIYYRTASATWKAATLT